MRAYCDFVRTESVELRLYFSSGARPELVRSEFQPTHAHPVQLSVRGKTAGAHQTQHTFQWSKAVRALCLVVLTHKCSSLGQLQPISGEAGSVAASLDYALSKEPQWILDMFGKDTAGKSYARRLLLRTNPNRKRSGPVTLSVNRTLLQPAQISIFVGRNRVTSVKKIDQLRQELLAQTTSFAPLPAQTLQEDLLLAVQIFYGLHLQCITSRNNSAYREEIIPDFSPLQLSAHFQRDCTTALAALYCFEKLTELRIPKKFGPVTKDLLLRSVAGPHSALLCDLSEKDLKQVCSRNETISALRLFRLPSEPYAIQAETEREKPLFLFLGASSFLTAASNLRINPPQRHVYLFFRRNSHLLSGLKDTFQKTLQILSSNPVQFRDSVIQALSNRAYLLSQHALHSPELSDVITDPSSELALHPPYDP